ncbi:hypothetical protein LUZ60_004654 [Juncus effusus]|nr:hypothetical protein LUZ60_004654 [Juncus effusus]
MDKRSKENTGGDLLSRTRSPSPSATPPFPPLSFSGDNPSRRRQWSSGPPYSSPIKHRTGRLASSIPPPSPSSSSISSKDIFTVGSFDDVVTSVLTLPQPDVQLNPSWPDVVINLIKRSSLNPNHGDPSTIHRVTHEILTGIDDSPKVVCLGPYFHSYRHSPALKHMQDHKWWCIQNLISRYEGLSEPDKTPILIQRCMVLMKAVDAQLRQAYSDSISLDNEELAEMMVLDGCFLLHLLLRHAPRGMIKKEKCMELEQGHMGTSSNRPWVWSMVIYDLLLMENQIPFFVVEIVFDVFKTKHDEKVDLLACMLNLFSEIQPHGAETISSFQGQCNIHHFLHAYYLSLLPQVNKKDYPSSQLPPLLSPLESIHGVTKLLEEGIKISKNRRSISFMDLSFKNGIMTIPTLYIHDYSIRLFRNIISYEQCGHDNISYVSSYLAFMQGLIADSSDMKIMNTNGIIVDRSSVDQKGDAFFTKFGELFRTGSSENYLRGLYSELNRYRGSRDEKGWTGRMQEHLSSSPLVFFSMGALVLFLLVTNIFLAYFSVYSCGPYKK